MFLRQTSAVKDMYVNVTEPVSRQIIYEFLRKLDMLEIFNNEIVIKSADSDTSSGTDEDGNAKLHENKAIVTLNHNLNPNSVKWETTTFRNLIASGDSMSQMLNIKPLFYDLQTQATLIEREVPYNVILETELQFKDRVSANEAMNKIYTSYTNGEMIAIQDIRYEYPLPDDVVTQLFGVYKMRGQDPANLDEFMLYLSDFSGGRINANINRHDIDGKRQVMVMRNCLNVVVGIDFSQEQADAEGVGTSTDLYKINLTLTAQFSRCNMVSQTHPIVIYNTMVPENMLIGVDPREAERLPGKVHPYFDIDKYRKWVDGQFVAVPEVVKSPWYDPWDVPVHSAIRRLNYREFLICALTVEDPEDEMVVTTINLETDLPYPLIPEIITELKISKDRALHFLDKFSVAVYVNNFPIEPTYLSLVDGVTLVIQNREIYPVYRLIISEYIGKPNGTITNFRVGNYDIVAHQFSKC
jgi:hypothetical protein